MPLQNGEFEFRGQRFGSADSGYPLAPGGFVVGAIDIRTEDIDNPSQDGAMFGRDYTSPVTYTWTLVIFHENEVTRWGTVADAIERLRAYWRTPAWTNRPGMLETLNLFHGARPVQIFGRPRGFAVDRSKIRQGYVIVTLTFRAPNDKVYLESVPEYGTTIGIVPVSTGGLAAPLVAPLTTIGTGQERAGHVDIIGTAPAPVQITFVGPVTNPYLQVSDQWRVTLDTTIAEGQSVTIDAINRTVLRNDGASLAGALSYASPQLRQLSLNPGPHDLVFGGISVSGLALAQVRWFPVQYSV